MVSTLIYRTTGSVKRLKNLVIDLTPMLQGGINGGAKQLVDSLVSGIVNTMINVEFTIVVGSKNALEGTELGEIILRSKKCTLYHAYTKNSIARLFFKLKLKNLVGQYKSVVFCPFGAPQINIYGLPAVSILYDMQYKRYAQFFSQREVNERDANFNKICKDSTSIIAISGFSASEAIENGCMEDKLRVIPIELGASEDQTVRDDSAEVFLSKGRYFIYPANFWRHKNHEVMIIAFYLAHAGGLETDIKLVLTGHGDGTRVDYLKQLISSYGLDKHIVVTGYTERGIVDSLIRCALALTYPSLYEGFGMPLVEAMVADLPICCSDINALTEVAGGCSLKFDPRKPEDIANALIRISNDEQLRKQLKKNARVKMLDYTNFPRMLKRYIDVFEDV